MSGFTAATGVNASLHMAAQAPSQGTVRRTTQALDVALAGAIKALTSAPQTIDIYA
jgi:hypothetical protein